MALCFVTAPTSMLFRDPLRDIDITSSYVYLQKNLLDLEMLSQKFACFKTFDVYCRITSEIVKAVNAPTSSV